MNLPGLTLALTAATLLAGCVAYPAAATARPRLLARRA